MGTASSRYKGFKVLIENLIDGDVSVTADEIEDRMYEAYQNDELSGSQYDKLSAMLMDA